MDKENVDPAPYVARRCAGASATPPGETNKAKKEGRSPLMDVTPEATRRTGQTNEGQTGGREAGPIPVFDEKPERERAKRAAAEARPPPPAHKPVVAARMLR